MTTTARPPRVRPKATALRLDLEAKAQAQRILDRMDDGTTLTSVLDRALRGFVSRNRHLLDD